MIILLRVRRFTSAVDHTTLSISDVQNVIKDLVKKGLYDQTLEFYKQELRRNPCLQANTESLFSIFPSLIKACSSLQFLHLGLQFHSHAVKTGLLEDTVVSNSFISMYAKTSITSAARQVFDKMPHRDNVSWNALINCYIQNGHCGNVFQLLKDMYFHGFAPKPELIAGIISICGRMKELRIGRAIHTLVVTDERIEESLFSFTALVDLYLRCHDSFTALCVFNQMTVKNEVSWTAMISGCAANHDSDMAMHCLRTMQVEGVKPNRVTLIAILSVCTKLGFSEQGREIHGYAFRHGFDTDHHFSAALIHMYSKFKNGLRLANLIFKRSTVKDVVMWSSVIGSHSQHGHCTIAIKHFKQMQAEGIQPNSVTLLAIISACITLSSVNLGFAVHGHVMKSGFNSDTYIGNALIDMYAKCGFLEASKQIFMEMPIKDLISWSTMIGGYGLHGCGEGALELFKEMQERGIEPDEITFLAVLSACNHNGLVEEGEKIFYHVMKASKIPLSIEHYACFIDLLGRSGKLEIACEVLRTMPMKPTARIYSSLLSACKVHEQLEIAASLANQLIESEPDNAANYTSLRMVCAEAGDWFGMEDVRKLMRERGLEKQYGFSKIELETIRL